SRGHPARDRDVPAEASGVGFHRGRDRVPGAGLRRELRIARDLFAQGLLVRGLLADHARVLERLELAFVGLETVQDAEELAVGHARVLRALLREIFEELRASREKRDDARIGGVPLELELSERV